MAPSRTFPFLRLPFTASKTQVATYLFGVALFSISFLVFLNSSISFVITDLIGQKDAVGDAVGTLGFADELVALVACPVWGLLSDRLGVRVVCVLAYLIIGSSLLVTVKARNVFPELLLARLFFSVGGAAATTMVTAILPAMTYGAQQIPTITVSYNVDQQDANNQQPVANEGERESLLRNNGPRDGDLGGSESRDSADLLTATPANTAGTSQVAGLVGMFTGIGALIALALFLPLPARFQNGGISRSDSIVYSFNAVGIAAFVVALLCGLGLRRLAGEGHKGFRYLLQSIPTTSSTKSTSYAGLATQSIKLGFTDFAIGVGYLGGFVARASSVAISLFIPLYVNAYFISSGLCSGNIDSKPSEIKDQCRRAYTLASILTGVSQLVALLCAPLFGIVEGRYPRFNAPLVFAAAAGIAGYVAFAQIDNPDFKADNGPGAAIFVVVALLGISQIGAIVCSLSLLGRGIQAETGISPGAGAADEHPSTDPAEPGARQSTTTESRIHLKGSVAGMYSLAGGAGILLLTKLGGSLFDSLTPGAPFYMMAIFNAILLVVATACGVIQEIKSNRDAHIVTTR